MHHLLGDPEAVGCYRTALDLYRELGERLEEAITLRNLGDTHQQAGEMSAARDAWLRAREIFEELGHPSADAVGARLASLSGPTR